MATKILCGNSLQKLISPVWARAHGAARRMNEARLAEISPDRMGAVLSSPFRIAPLINRASIPAGKLPIRPEPSAGLRYHLPAERRELKGGPRARVSGDPELSA